MKKKLVSLTLIIILMCSLTVTSFADYGKVLHFDLASSGSDNDIYDFELWGFRLDEYDDRLKISLVVDNPYADYTVNIYRNSSILPFYSTDCTGSTYISSYDIGYNFDNSNDYSFRIINKSNSSLSGTMMLLFQ
ncbi:MAG: hypothetical protein MJA82_15015 [Clostridia bacterium]|nr:hypothetical protein [Clostridia bacterium]